MKSYAGLCEAVESGTRISDLCLGHTEYMYYRLIRDIYNDCNSNRITTADYVKELADLQTGYEREIQHEEKRRMYFAYYQSNIKKAGVLRAEISKAESPNEKFALALECIECMTGEKGFKERNLKELR